jgi:Tfp pilus assembly protein PilF
LSRIPGKLREAAEALRQGMLLDHSDVDLHVELGMIYQKTGLTQKAVATFTEALKMDPKHKTAKAQLEKLQS